MKRAYREFAIDLCMNLLQRAKNEGFSLRLISKKTGLSEHTLKGYYYGEKVPSVATFVAILDVTRLKEPIDEIAELIDCAVIDISSYKKSKNIGDLISHTAKITKETSDVLSEISKSLEDGKLTHEEKKKIIKEINEAIEVLLSCKEFLKKEEDY